MHMMNQTTVKPWKTTPVPVHTAAPCNFKHFKFAIQNSQIAIQKMILLCKFLFCIAGLLRQIYERNRSLVEQLTISWHRFDEILASGDKHLIEFLPSTKYRILWTCCTMSAVWTLEEVSPTWEITIIEWWEKTWGRTSNCGISLRFVSIHVFINGLFNLKVKLWINLHYFKNITEGLKCLRPPQKSLRFLVIGRLQNRCGDVFVFLWFFVGFFCQQGNMSCIVYAGTKFPIYKVWWLREASQIGQT